MKRRFIVLLVVVLVIGLSLLAIQYASGSNKSPLKGLQGTTEQLKMPPKGFY